MVSTCHEPHANLLIGYKILRHTLKQEGDLNLLKKLRQATFRSPPKEVGHLMTTIASTSRLRGKELDRLWREELPVIDTSLTPLSDIGDAIQNTAEAMGSKEMLTFLGSTKEAWSARFLLLQAQATRMVAAMALSLAERDPNPQRRAWLEALAVEYETLRDQIVEQTDIASATASLGVVEGVRGVERVE
jgi:hypothetical protein